MALNDDLVSTLQSYCSFGDERIYVLLAIARKKENEEYTSTSEPVIREIVDDIEEVERKIDELDHVAKRFESDFRLYISANARNTMDAFFRLRKETDEWLKMKLNGNKGVDEKFKRIDSEFKSVLQKHGCRDDTNFIFDIDDCLEKQANELEQKLKQHTSVKLRQETPNGFHIVTEPFNFNELETEIEYELKKDGMIFLSYIGE